LGTHMEILVSPPFDWGRSFKSRTHYQLC